MKRLLIFAMLMMITPIIMAQDLVNAVSVFKTVTAGLHNGDSYRKPSGSLTAGVVSIPNTVDSSADFASTAGILTTLPQAGPMSVGGSDLMVSRGSALVGPSGGAVYSPQQRAAMDIKSLIKSLK